MKLSFRQAKQDDIDWLEAFYERVMRPYVELTHSWDESLFRESFEPEVTLIIQCDGEDVGMLKTYWESDMAFIKDIQIREDYQGRGIGTSIVQSIIERAHREGRDVRLKVLKGNPAKCFYERLGFAEYTEFDNCFEMICKTPAEDSRNMASIIG